MAQFVATFAEAKNERKEHVSLILAILAERSLACVEPYIGKFLKIAAHPNATPPLRRQLMHTMIFIRIPKNLDEAAINLSFPLLRDRTELIAVRVFAMAVLANQRLTYPDLKNELITLLSKSYPRHQQESEVSERAYCTCFLMPSGMIPTSADLVSCTCVLRKTSHVNVSIRNSIYPSKTHSSEKQNGFKKNYCQEFRLFANEMAEEFKSHICKSCGNSFTGIYCNQCGEKVLLPADRSLSTFLSNIMIAITFADSKFIKTLWLVLTKPGFISREFAEGRRVRYLRPLSLFFVLNLIYFLFPVIQLFNASLHTQLLTPFRHLYAHWVALKMVALQIKSIASFEIIYNEKTIGLAKLLVMVFVFLASLPLNLLYRQRNRYFVDHVGFMVELACFNLFMNAIFLTLITRLLGLGAYLNELTLTGIFAITNLYFLILGTKTFYMERSWRMIIKPVFILLVLKVALECYRAILFLITMLTL